MLWALLLLLLVAQSVVDWVVETVHCCYRQVDSLLFDLVDCSVHSVLLWSRVLVFVTERIVG